VKFVELGLQRCPCRKHRSRDALEHRLAGDQLLNARRKILTGHVTDLQAKATKNAPNAQLHIDQLFLKLLARHQQRPHFLRTCRLGMDGTKPSHPHQLRDAASIFAIRLDRHRRKRRLHVPRLQQLRRETRTS
jgi:hypothetical protein